MKSLVTVVVASAALSWPGALSVRSQEKTAPQPPAVLQGAEQDEQSLANSTADVQQQVEVELRPELEAGVADVVEAHRAAEFASLRKDVDTATAQSNEQGGIFLKFFNAPIDQILEKYSDLTCRTVLRPASLQASVTITKSTPLTRTEAIQALDGALALNGITMMPQGDKFIKADLSTMAQAQLAQAAAPAAPRAVAGAAATPAPAARSRLQFIVNKGRGGPGKGLVIRTSDAEAKAQANLEEDLAVMTRILDKAVAKRLDDERGNRFMGINVLFAPGSGSVRNLYLEGYGALFLLNVNFPLLPPPEKPEPTKEKSETDTTWEEAKKELYGQSDAWAQVGKPFRFSTSPDPQQEYDKDKVDELTESLLEALKNATNIRDLKADESITICVFGGVSAAPGKAGKARTWVKRTPGSADADPAEVFVTDSDDGPATHGTIMTIRVKKSDADAFAKGKLNLDEFRKKASVTIYAGDTGGWSGGAVFGAP